MLVNYKEVLNNEKFVKVSNNLWNYLYKMGCPHLDLEEFELDWWELSREFELFYSFSWVKTPHTKKCEENYDYCIDEHLTWFTNRFYITTEDDLIDLRIIENQFKSMVKPVNCDNCSSTAKDLE